MTHLQCAAGLAELATKKYKCAARHFLQANVDHCDLPELLSPSNVAVFGGLCALATYDRAELQKHVISSRYFTPMGISLIEVIKIITSSFLVLSNFFWNWNRS